MSISVGVASAWDGTGAFESVLADADAGVGARGGGTRDLTVVRSCTRIDAPTFDSARCRYRTGVISSDT